MKFILFNGAKTKEAWNNESPDFIDDWKPEEMTFECDSVSGTYGQRIAIYDENDILEEFWFDKNGLIEHKGKFYGDFRIA